jgi:arylsulfatase A-like enzyme
MVSKINRRDFLKLSLILALSKFGFPEHLQFSPAHRPALANSNKPNVLILVFDALSAYHMSLYGYHRQTTPNINQFANRATVYHNHYAGGNFTTSGTASLLTGTYPWTHRAFHTNGTMLLQYTDRTLFSMFNHDYHTMFYTHNPLVSFLFPKGNPHIDDYTETEGLCVYNNRILDKTFVNDANPSYWSETRLTGYDSFTPSSLFLSILGKHLYQMNFEALEEKYAKRFPHGLAHNYNKQVFFLEDAIDWIAIQTTQAPRPFLAYIHLFPPHSPYTPRLDFVDIFKDDWQPPQKPQSVFSNEILYEDLDEKRRLYDEYLAYADSEFGRLVQQLEESGILDTTILVLTSDHGEMFERGILGHLAPVMYQPLLRIPLIISTPGQQQRFDVLQASSAIDVLSTLLALTGQEIPQWIEGAILPPFNRANPDPGRCIFAVDAKKSPKNGILDVAILKTVINCGS